MTMHERYNSAYRYNTLVPTACGLKAAREEGEGGGTSLLLSLPTVVDDRYTLVLKTGGFRPQNLYRDIAVIVDTKRSHLPVSR